MHVLTNRWRQRIEEKHETLTLKTRYLFFKFLLVVTKFGANCQECYMFPKKKKIKKKSSAGVDQRMGRTSKMLDGASRRFFTLKQYDNYFIYHM